MTTWVFPPNYDLARLWNSKTLGAFVYMDHTSLKGVNLEKVTIKDDGDFEFEEMEMIPPWRQLLKEYQHE